MLSCWNDILISCPEVSITMTLTIRLRNATPQLLATLFAPVANQPGDHLSSPATAGQSRSSVSGSCSGQMTTIHPTPMWSLVDPSDQVRAAWFSIPGARLLFFEPVADGRARHAKGALQPTQAAALFISAENLFSCCGRIAIWLRLLTAAPLAILAPVALLVIPCAPIAHKVFALTVMTFQDDGNHTRERLSSHLICPLPLWFCNFNSTNFGEQQRISGGR